MGSPQLSSASPPSKASHKPRSSLHTKIIRHILILILVLAATANAQTVSPYPAPTIIKTVPYIINSPGYYQLGADLTATNTTGNIITISASNVTLDFAGHYISGPSNNTASKIVGVYASEEGNLVIQNGTVAFCYQGIYLTGNGTSNSLNINQRVQNMLVTYCYTCGIQFTSASNSVIAQNRISFILNGSGVSHVEGIYDNAGTGNIADGNIITNVTNTVTNGVSAGIAGALSNTASSLTVTNNRISNVTNPTSPGVALGIYEGTFVVGNTVNNAYQAIYTAGKYQNNLTFASAESFGGGTDAGGNN